MLIYDEMYGIQHGEDSLLKCKLNHSQSMHTTLLSFDNYSYMYISEVKPRDWNVNDKFENVEMDKNAEKQFRNCNISREPFVYNVAKNQTFTCTCPVQLPQCHHCSDGFM